MTRRTELVCWAVLFVLQLAPVWWFPCFPAQDGPVHLENARILTMLGSTDPPLFREYFKVNLHLAPNWLGHLLLAALLFVFPPMIAEKILVSVYIIATPLAVRYAVRAFRRESAAVAALSFPLLYNCLLHYGFYNFCLSIPVFFLAVGWWQRDRSLLVTELWLLLLYGCHIVSWMLGLAALAILRPRDSLRLAVAALPTIVLAIWFLAGRDLGAGPRPPVPFSVRWNGLWRFTTSVFSYDETHQWAGAALGLCLLALAAFCAARRIWGAPALFSVFVLALYFVAPPGSAGGGLVLERLNLYFFFSLLLWVALAAWSARWQAAFYGGAAVFSVLLFALNAPWYREANRFIAEFLTGAPAIPANTAFVPLLYEFRGPGLLAALYGDPLRHTASHLALQRVAVNLDNYEAETDLFPVTFHADRNPAVFIGEVEENPPRVHLDSPRIGSVVIWDPARAAPPPPDRFELVFTSSAGNLRVFRARR